RMRAGWRPAHSHRPGARPPAPATTLAGLAPAGSPGSRGGPLAWSAWLDVAGFGSGLGAGAVALLRFGTGSRRSLDRDETAAAVLSAGRRLRLNAWDELPVGTEFC